MDEHLGAAVIEALDEMANDEMTDDTRGARIVCHGAETRGLRIGSIVSIEAIDNIYYFAHMGAMERARLFWRRAGHAGDRVNAIARSLAKRVMKGRTGAES